MIKRAPQHNESTAGGGGREGIRKKHTRKDGGTLDFGGIHSSEYRLFRHYWDTITDDFRENKVDIAIMDLGRAGEAKIWGDGYSN